MKTVSMLLKTFSSLAAVALLVAMLTPTAVAQNPYSHDIQGTWTFFVHLDGAPPCECIQLARFRSDGSIDGPANDHFSGPVLGEWSSNGARIYSFVLIQNNINPDGSAGGEWVIHSTMIIGGDPDQATGTSKAQLLSNSGAVLFEATATFKATRLRAQ